MDPADEYKSPFNFEEGVNASYLYLSPSEVVTPPSSPLVAVRGAQRPDSLPEVGEDAVTTVDTTTSLGLTEEEQEELQNELAKVEEEIQTLSQVLAAKEKQVAELKRKLGITPLNELRQNLSKGWQEVTTSTAYRRTSETLSQAGQKASAAFSSVGSAITRKLDDVRNTPTFKSFEEKVETLKTKMTPTSSTGNINEVINSTANSEAVESQSEGTEMKREEPH
ncbi:tumor protein D52 isoform X3 [Denticeps clupeoides]|uniref:tumor protein D52 isoform X3 n=1 Tax=Denticeps clupeoides TaxID=299321 RepID=UPI0010A48FE6|nr:tumor protein D52 isoform X3 [Denticeps clupeoides]